MNYQFYTADVFTDQIFGGNQLAVFPEAEGLTSTQMQLIAKEFNYSETVFVLPPQTPQGTRRLRIFTPGAELPFAGHPTVGTAYILATIGNISITDEITTLIFEEGVGLVPVKIRTQNGKPVYTELTAAQLPEFGDEPPSIPELAAMLSLDRNDLMDGKYSPQAVSCGVPFLFIPIHNREILARVNLNKDRWKQLLSGYWANSIYVFCFDPELDGSDVRSRMFAPALGVEEDPATGSAATALGGYLGSRDPLSEGTLHWRIEQGFEMGRPSLLQVETDKKGGNITQIRVGGASVLVSQGMMNIPI
ncbi:phenazine biosynthesis protein PhzF family [Gloeothece citriformis PCC 7424]|uniref:Phenazine biosynthesis protein PhzF family n=1 Tax=Gloeothece citriformis (strain PCC 7424) TaxID=65393 RepID=B7KFX1_GLOC7|nr:PhzF family phenazine biosynthesis protein [Gloeothece citriformis]ACK69164.1 phenazine biosynthesis protein PhzF family [Gloeothece citriformis PCC 7424]